MRNKLFLAFLAVIVTALVSNLLYGHFMTTDFEDYVSGTREDTLYWILASAEGASDGGAWDHARLHEVAHWAIMLGFDIRIRDMQEKELVSSGEVMTMLSPSMRRRMESISDIGSAKGEFEVYPLYQEGREVGILMARELARPGEISRKEATFKRRGRTFLIVSFLIAGGGAILLSAFFSLSFSRPLNRMKKAVASMAEGDFGVRLAVDTTDEIGRLAEQFNFMAEALEREEALRKHLTSNIAHELRTPLAVMKANVEAMIDGVVEDHARGLQNIHEEVDKLILLVSGIEDVTKAEASFFSRRNPVLVDLGDFLGGISDKLRPLAAGKNLTMRIAGAEDLTVTTDPERLERIMMNILTNAIRHTGEGGVTIRFGADRDSFFIQVEDTGVGIPEEKIPLIFRRFYRGEGSEGIGLGLAIVKELLDIMGGSIDVSSRPGEGSLFTVRLPLVSTKG